MAAIDFATFLPVSEAAFNADPRYKLATNAVTQERAGWHCSG